MNKLELEWERFMGKDLEEMKKNGDDKLIENLQAIFMTGAAAFAMIQFDIFQNRGIDGKIDHINLLAEIEKFYLNLKKDNVSNNI